MFKDLRYTLPFPTNILSTFVMIVIRIFVERKKLFTEGIYVFTNTYCTFNENVMSKRFKPKTIHVYTKSLCYLDFAHD